MSEFFDPCPAGGVFISEPPWDATTTRCPECGREIHLTGYESRWPDHSRAAVIASYRELDRLEGLELMREDMATMRNGSALAHPRELHEFTLENGDIIIGFYPDGESWERIRRA